MPSSAVIRTGQRDIAFVYRGEGIFEPRELKLGITDGKDRIQVISGIAEEEAVVVSGQFLLDSESRIQEAVRKLRSGDTSGSGDTSDHGDAPVRGDAGDSPEPGNAANGQSDSHSNGGHRH